MHVSQQGVNWFWVGWLDQVVVEPRFTRPPFVLFLPIARQSDQQYVFQPGQFPQARSEVKTVDAARQPEVQKDDLRPKGASGVQDGGRFVDALDFVAFQPEYHPQGLPRVDVADHYQ